MIRKLSSLSHVPFRVLPREKYIVTGPPPDYTSDIASAIDDKGNFVDIDTHEYCIHGIMTSLQQADVSLVPEGMAITGLQKLSTPCYFPMPGDRQYQSIHRFTLHDEKNGARYLLKSRTLKGVMFQYVCELDISPRERA